MKYSEKNAETCLISKCCGMPVAELNGVGHVCQKQVGVRNAL
jgi:hypothetical protein